MKKNFSNAFKDLRKQREMTQEQIAEVLGVSCQAVSKWETNTSYPDISLLPVIADYFGVSVDCLLGHDTGKQLEEIHEACAKAEAMIAEKRYMEAIPPLREMLVKHPGNEKLMYQLAWNLSWTIKNGSMDNYNEAILLYEKILTISSDTEMILKVKRDLIHRYYTINEITKARAIAETLPPFAFCREKHLGLCNLLDGRELSEDLQSNIQLFGQTLLSCLEYFEDEKILSAEEKKPYTTESAKKKIALLKEILEV
ncbi:MAG: helix-turn-helix domain-containing protein [Clostridia bacterium]|nr:helix-turn-helix domain-containing protein [Clostridia bacterium]